MLEYPKLPDRIAFEHSLALLVACSSATTLCAENIKVPQVGLPENETKLFSSRNLLFVLVLPVPIRLTCHE